MRNLNRPMFEPPTLARARAKNLAVSSGHWRKPDVRGALRAMQGQSCAYCQQDLGSRGLPGSVDHFRPSSAYGWLAYRFDNLFLTCHACNSFKTDEFPIDGGASCAVCDSDLAGEPRLLIDPANDSVDQLLSVDYGDAQYPFQILVPDPSTLEYRRVRNTLDCLHLSDDVEYRRERIRVLSKVVDQINKQRAGGLTEAEQESVRRQVCRWQPFGEMVQGLIRWSLAETDSDPLCPSALEECLWLVDSLVEHLAGPATSDYARRQQEEICWCLAILMASPPDGVAADEIRTQIDDPELLVEIEGLLSQ